MDPDFSQTEPRPEIVETLWLRRRVEALEEELRERDDLLAILENSIKRLRSDILLYGEHRVNCPARQDKTVACTCGYTKLLKQGDEP